MLGFTGALWEPRVREPRGTSGAEPLSTGVSLGPVFPAAHWEPYLGSLRQAWDLPVVTGADRHCAEPGA